MMSQCRHQTRRAAGMDARRFPTEPGWRVGKSRNELRSGAASSGKAISFGYFSLGQQRKVTRSPAGEWKLCFCTSSEDQTLSSAVAAEFISFVNRQKKRNQRKTISRRSSPNASLVPGFSDSASCLGRKTPHIHVRRPPGLVPASAHRCPRSSSSNSNSNSKSKGNHKSA